MIVALTNQVDVRISVDNVLKLFRLIFVDLLTDGENAVGNELIYEIETALISNHGKKDNINYEKRDLTINLTEEILLTVLLNLGFKVYYSQDVIKDNRG